MSESLEQMLYAYAQRLLPRMLTQVCRDPGSVCYGCFDRNWWHYKIRDFPSIILQQGGYALWCAADIGLLPGEARQIAAGSCRFWNARAIRKGAFEEYYPWEQGYPPLAFSALAIAKLVHAGAVSADAVMPGLKVAARQLVRRFEAQAANQQVAGLAAAAWVAKVAPDLVPGDDLQRLKRDTLALQTDEGWFVEYGGPDLGYLAVTMDCLWDLYDATGDEDYITSASRAMRFIQPFTQLPSRGAGMHNARNTDYIVPYGIARFLAHGGQDAQIASSILQRAWGTLASPDHFAHAIDDRYWCHYIGHSLIRSIPLLKQMAQATVQVKHGYFSRSGHLLAGAGQTELAISTKKGGIFQAWHEGRTLADFGWRVMHDGREYVTHWWGDGWSARQSPNEVEITGHAPKHKETLASPWTHMALRIISLVLGRRIIARLKNRMIFKREGGLRYSRRIAWSEGRIEVTDTFYGLNENETPSRAPRSSVRHVASADSHHHEDLRLVCGWKKQEKINRDKEALSIVTVYTPEVGAAP